jgi:hypothetical protein
MHMRASTQFRSNLANGNYSAVANTLDTLNYNSAFNPTLPPIPAGVNGQVLRHNNFPENFIRTNPQFNTAHMVASINSNNYHSMAATFTLRPTAGINTQSTYTWSKNLGVFGEVGRTYTDPADRHADYAILRDSRTHDFRTNGTFTLPIGPNRRFFSGASGTVARILEDWSMSWIINVNSGEPLSIGAQSMLYANGTADIVGSFDPKAAKVVFPEGANSGNYFLGGELSTGQGGLAGKAITDEALRILSDVAERAAGRIAIKAAGGIFSGADAMRFLSAGATAVELYSGFIYRGPNVGRTIARELLDEIEARGLTSVRHAAEAARAAS